MHTEQTNITDTANRVQNEHESISAQGVLLSLKGARQQVVGFLVVMHKACERGEGDIVIAQQETCGVEGGVKMT